MDERGSEELETQPVDLIDQLLAGARDQLRRGQVEDAIDLLQGAIELVAQAPQPVGENTTRLLREVTALIEAGNRFWAEWARLVSPDAGLYSADGNLLPSAESAPARLAIRG